MNENEMFRRMTVSFINLLFFCFLLCAQSGAQESLSLFPVVQAGKWGYIDQTGAVVFQPRFGYAYNVSEGLARVKIGQKSGFIDRTGKLVVGARFEGAGEFSEGLARVMLGGKWGFLDKSGRLVIPIKFGWAGDF